MTIIPAHRAVKLSPEIALEIRAERERGASLQSLAEKYGVSEGQISRICAGHTWKNRE